MTEKEILKRYRGLSLQGEENDSMPKKHVVLPKEEREKALKEEEERMEKEYSHVMELIEKQREKMKNS